MREHALCYIELAVGIAGIVYGAWSEHKRRSQLEWVHMALVNLKPSIDGPRAPQILAAINNMLEFLKLPRRAA